MQVICLFSGQGSQYYHMGKSLFEQNSLFRNYLMQLDNILRDLAGFSVIEQVYASSYKMSEPFCITRYTHPAIFIFQYALFNTLIEMGMRIPDAVIGYSVGEFVAAVVAGILPAEDALMMVVNQANALEECSNEGSMFAILDKPDGYIDSLSEYSIELAAINFNRHFIISGRKNDIVSYLDKMGKKNICFQEIAVSRAFHSSLIDSARNKFIDSAINLYGKEPLITMFSPATGSTVGKFQPIHYWHAIRNQINFKLLIEQIEAIGSNAYVDVGFSGTLANFVKYNIPDGSLSKSFSIFSPFSCSEKNLSNFLDKNI